MKYSTEYPSAEDANDKRGCTGLVLSIAAVVLAFTACGAVWARIFGLF